MSGPVVDLEKYIPLCNHPVLPNTQFPIKYWVMEARYQKSCENAKGLVISPKHIPYHL